MVPPRQHPRPHPDPAHDPPLRRRLRGRLPAGRRRALGRVGAEEEAGHLGEARAEVLAAVEGVVAVAGDEGPALVGDAREREEVDAGARVRLPQRLG